MKYVIENYMGYKFIKIPELTNLGLKHCFTTSTMDMRLNSKNISNTKYYNHTFKYLNTKPSMIFFNNQKHTSNVTIINNNNYNNYNKFLLGKIIDNNDALITSLNNYALISLFADCTPIILFDKEKKIQANIHSGWKGTLNKISENAINKMINLYNSNPSDIIAILGPSIGYEDFEVELDVLNLFRSKYPKVKAYYKRKNNTKYLINLDKINTYILEKNGILQENILNINLSTYSYDLFHSYRRDKKNYKLMAAITIL